MMVVVIGPNLRNQSKGTFHVHAEGCADIERDPKRYGYRLVAPHMTIEAESRADVARDIYADMIEDDDLEDEEVMDAYVSDFHFAPCVDALK